MARPTRSPKTLLERIDAALPHAKRTDIVTADPMAEMLGMSWRNLLDVHIKTDAQFPLLQRGSQGRDYKFEVVKVLRHLRKKCLAQIAGDDAKARNLARLTNVAMPPPSDGGPISYSELQQAISAHRQIMTLKSEQGQYVPASEHRQVVEALLETVSKAIIGAAPMLDPIGQLPPAIREGLDKILADLLGRIGADVTTLLKDYHGSNPAQRGSNVHRTGEARR